MVERIEVASFHEAIRLATRHPVDTQAAQYSLPHAVAAAMVRGALGPAEVDDASIADPEIRRLADGMTLVEDEACCAAFPLQRYAFVTLVMKDGRRIESGRSEARGDPEAPFSAAEHRAKFHAYADAALGPDRARAIVAAAEGLKAGAPLAPLADLLVAPAGGAAAEAA